jgi:hypothetical protein
VGTTAGTSSEEKRTKGYWLLALLPLHATCKIVDVVTLPPPTRRAQHRPTTFIR